MRSRVFVLALLLAALALSGCSTGGSGNVTPPSPPTTTLPPVQAEAPVKHVAWYDLLTLANLPAANRTSNTIMLREREDEYLQFLGAGYKTAIVGCYGRDKVDKGVAIVKAAKAAGMEVPYFLFMDEPALGGLSVAYVNQVYDLYRAALDAEGHQSTKLAPMLSLAGQGANAWDRWGIPKMGFVGHDSFYSGASNQIHLVRDRLLKFLAMLDAAGLGNLEILHVLKVFSANTPGLDSEDLNPEWVLRQIRCAAGSGTSEYDWRNPVTGELAWVKVEPLPEQYLRRTKALAFYKMDGRDTDAEFYGANTPGLIPALETWAGPRGLTLN